MITVHSSFLYEAKSELEGYTLGYAKRNPGSHNWYVFAPMPHTNDGGVDWVEVARVPTATTGNMLADKVIRSILEVL